MISLYVLNINLSPDIQLASIFSHFVGYLSTLLAFSFAALWEFAS
jgi:hypothetical protein